MAEPGQRDPLIWRVPPWQVAVLFLLAAAAAAANLYAHPSGSTRVVTILIGLVAFVMAVTGMRAYLVVDAEGAAVRFVGYEQWLPWPEVAKIEVVAGVRGSDTIRFTRLDGRSVDVPPSLLQPTRATSKPSYRRLLESYREQFDAIRAEAGPRD